MSQHHISPVPRDDTLVYFFHIPKTAGTSLRSLLQAIFGAEHTSPRLLWDYIVRGEYRVTEETRCVAGHLSGIFPLMTGRRLRMFTVLREPVARAVSYINQAKRFPERARYDISKGLSVLEYCHHPELRNSVSNLQSRYLSTLAIPQALGLVPGGRAMDRRDSVHCWMERCLGPMSEEELQDAALAALDAFDFVGVRERYVDVCRCVMHQYGCVDTKWADNRWNVSKSTELAVADLTAEELETLRALNRVDQIVYEEASKRFEQFCSQIEVPGVWDNVLRVDSPVAHDRPWVFGAGWSQDEPTHRWSEGTRSEIRFRIGPGRAPTRLSLVGHPLGEQRTTVALNGQPLHSGVLDASGFPELNIPAGALHCGSSTDNVLEFTWPDARQPGNGDPRQLGFSLRSFELRSGKSTACLCTLAIHGPYRRRARQLCADAPEVPWIVVTDEPGEFEDLPVRAIRHLPTGPMAIDYLKKPVDPHMNQGAGSYHDKRFALQAALEEYDTAIFLDADSRIHSLPPLGKFPPGIAALPVIRSSILEHLQRWGPWRIPAFEDLARHLTGSVDALHRATWCQEACIAISKDGREAEFFSAWERGAAFLTEREVLSGEGGVIGLAAHCAGWTVDFEVLTPYAASIQHEGGGPKTT